MKYFGTQNQLSRRLEESEEYFQPLLNAMLANRRLFSADESDPPHVTEAIRYEQHPQDQINPPDSPPTDGPAGDIHQLYADEFDAPLRFQSESWETITEQLQSLEVGTGTRGVLTTAPTGFGKTEAFMGPIINELAKGHTSTGTAVFVYPRTALLKDQLSRVLRLMHSVKENTDYPELSCGVYYGDIPFYKDEVESSDSLYNPYSNVFSLTDSWEDSDDREGKKPFFLNPDNPYKYLNVPESDISFSDDEVILNRSSMVYGKPPNIIITTLSSLENFCLKPNYDIMENIDTIVFDEVHLYNGVYGSHAANIIQNLCRLKREQGDSLLLVGSSATLEAPTRFANKMFGLDPTEVDVIKPSEEDYKDEDDVEKYENYYFMLSSDDVSLPSTYIQQSMLLGHTLLQPKNDDPQKMLSFIDSRSSVNQKATQFRDADRTRRLWQHHVDTEEEDWRAVAGEMDSNLIEQPLDMDTAHSNVSLSSSDIANSDMLISTSSLEVGIDIGDLNVVSQYHAPLNLSSFVQRAGRAGRDEQHSHIVTFLSQNEGDLNHFHRADRFLEADVTTPLNPDNPIVKWIHNSLLKYYLTSQGLDNPNQPGRQFLENYLTKERPESDLDNSCKYPQFYKFLNDPDSFIDEIVDEPPQRLFSNRPVVSLKKDVEEFKSDTQSRIEPLAELMGTNAQSLLQEADPDSRITAELQNAAFAAVNDIRRRLERLGSEYGEETIRQDLTREVKRLNLTGIEFGDDVSVETVCDRLEEYIENFGAYEEGSGGPELSKQSREIRRALQALDTVVGDAGEVHGGDSPEVTYDYGAEKVETFQETLNAYRKGTGDQISVLHKKWKRAYYLGESLDQLSDYYSTSGESYESAYAVKFLLRSVYYFDRFLWMNEEEDTTEEVWYVPKNYFGDAGTTFTRVTETPGGDTSTEEQSLHSLVTQYYPYRAEFSNRGTDLHIFQPETRVENNDVYFDLKEEDKVSARHIGDGILQPESISVDRIADCSGGSGRGILTYCPTCLNILENPGQECSQHNEQAFGSFYSSANLETELQYTDPGTQISENLELAGFSMDVSMSGVDLEIRKAKYIRSFDSYVPKKKEPVEESIRFPEDKKLGFNLETRGLVWDFSPLLETLNENDDLVATIADLHDTSEMGFDEMSLHTAAHFLTVLVGDVAGVDVDKLLYDFDEEDETVTVFERAEGGQGVVDLFAEKLKGDPSKVLESLYRVGFDTRAIVENLWKEEEFINALPDDSLETIDDETVKQAVENCSTWTAPDRVVKQRVVEEVQYSIDRVLEVGETIESTDSSVDFNVISLRSEIAEKVTSGTSRERVVNGASLPPMSNNDERQEVKQKVNNLLINEKVDGCKNTLHIRSCTHEGQDTTQSDLLSYKILRSIIELIIHSDTAGSIDDYIIGESILPSKLDGENFNSLSF